MRALSALADASPLITRLEATVARVRSDTPTPGVELSTGGVHETATVVIAGGAWASLIDGVPFLGAVTPARGQLISYDSIGLRHVVYGPRGYLVPRAHLQTIAGSTMENVGFDATTTDEGLARVRSASEEIAPALSISRVQTSWAGLRPVTPDLLPLIGAGPASSCRHLCVRTLPEWNSSRAADWRSRRRHRRRRVSGTRPVAISPGPVLG